mgnify:CR=1
PKRQIDVETITADQSAGRVEQRQFAAAIVPLICPEQLERCAAATLVDGSMLCSEELQLAGAMPRVRAVHRRAAWRPHSARSITPIGSDPYQMRGSSW